MTPDVGELVEFGPGPPFAPDVKGLYRVSGWARPVRSVPTKEPEWSAYREAVSVDGQKLQWCTRSEATHVILDGMRRAYAPAAQVSVVGLVDWPDEIIESERKRADRQGAMHPMVTS